MNYKVILLSLLILVFCGVAGCLYFANRSLRSPNGDIGENTLIKIEKGATVSEVAEKLFSQKLIKNKTIYINASKFFGKKANSGYFEIQANSSMADIINLIDSGKIKLIKITIPEGWRVEQIAAKLDQQNILDYQDFVDQAVSLEGKLFPDTYYLNPKMTASEVINMMTEDYANRTSGMNVSEKDLILASIIEREAAKDEERALIAGIYQNRLNRGMKLEADPTVQYGRDNNLLKSASDKINLKLWQGVSFADYKNVRSEYNTYLIDGLPPRPICNPGIKSIQAAQNPAQHNYVYFLQHDGQIYPAKSVAEHDANRRKILGQS